MKLHFIDWIWNVRGRIPLAPGQTAEIAISRLDPLFHEPGTTHARADRMLTFSKKDPAAQDRMSVFDSGVLVVEDDAAGPVLSYRLASRALLFCFLAPLLFLAFGQLTILAGKLERPASEAAQTAKDGKKKEEEAVRELNPVDKFLGAPAPEKPKGDAAGKAKEKMPSPTPAYVFAALFAVLYAVGRILEAKLVRRLFSKRLQES